MKKLNLLESKETKEAIVNFDWDYFYTLAHHVELGIRHLYFNGKKLEAIIYTKCDISPTYDPSTDTNAISYELNGVTTEGERFFYNGTTTAEDMETLSDILTAIV